MKSIFRFNVFGTIMRVQRKDSHWLLFKESETSLPMRIYDVVIPDDLTAEQLAGYLDDIYHEYASIAQPNVVALDQIL